jgi:hypothetical protein
MKCEKCGHSPAPNPIAPAITAIGNGFLLDFLNHTTPEPGFYANWHAAFWWFTAIICGLSIVMFFVTCGIRIGRATSHQRT